MCISTYLLTCFSFSKNAKTVLGEYSVSISYLKEIGPLVHATNRQSFNRNSYWTEKKKVNEKTFKQLNWGKKSWKGESKRWKACNTV